MRRHWTSGILLVMRLRMGLLFGLSSGCVVIADEDHCANRDGDATCLEENDTVGWQCSACVRNNHGCVMNEVKPECRDSSGDIAGSDPDATAATMSSSVGDTLDTVADTIGESGGAACDPPCADDTPFCVEGQCMASCVDAGGDAFCAEMDPATPQCHTGWGRCVECFAGPSPACEATEPQCTDAFECTGCTEHAQCLDSACDLEIGRCMDDAPQIWVNSTDCMAPGQGSEDSPYCTIADGIAAIGTSDSTAILHIVSGTQYSEPLLWSGGSTDRRLAVIGHGFPPLLAGDPNAVEVDLGNTLYLSRVRILSAMTAGAYCNDSVLWMDDSTIVDSATGIDASGCRVHVRRSEILRSPAIGIRTDNESDLWLWSSIIGSGGSDDAESRAIQANTGTYDIRFSTIANNLGTSGPSMWCSGVASGPVRNSIVMSPSGSSVNCPWAEFETSAVDTETVATGDGGNTLALYTSSRFVNAQEDDYRLGSDPSSIEPLLDLGRWSLGDPRVDIDDTARTGVPGAIEVVGADSTPP